MPFASIWKSLAASQWGFAPHVRLTVRTVGASPQTVILTGTEETVSMNPIVRKRERKFGVVQGQAWQIQLTNNNDAIMGYELPRGYARLEVGLHQYEDDGLGNFEDTWYWETVAVGRIIDVEVTTDGVATIEVGDLLYDLVNTTILREMNFSTSAWAGDVSTVSKADASSDYDMTQSGAGVGIASGQDATIIDQKYIIEFVTATTYKVVREDGTETGTHGITTNFAFAPESGGSSTLTLGYTGFDQTAAAYTAGDKFAFYTSAPRAAADLAGVELIRHLLVDVVGLTAYDFDTESSVDPLYDSTNWDALVALTTGDTFGGYWPVGSQVITMIQGILAVLHASLYITPDGKIAIWMLQPVTQTDLTLNGDPAQGDVQILAGVHTHDVEETYNRVIYRYKDTETGNERVYENSAASSIYTDDRLIERDLGWRVRSLSVESGADRCLSRFADKTRRTTLEATFAGAAMEIGETVTVREPALNLFAESLGIIEVSMDPIGDRSTVVGIRESVALDLYAKVADSGGTINQIDGTGKVW